MAAAVMAAAVMAVVTAAVVTVAGMAATSGMAIGGAMVQAPAGDGPPSVMSGSAINRTSEYLRTSNSAAHHFVGAPHCVVH